MKLKFRVPSPDSTEDATHSIILISTNAASLIHRTKATNYAQLITFYYEYITQQFKNRGEDCRSKEPSSYKVSSNKAGSNKPIARAIILKISVNNKQTYNQ